MRRTRGGIVITVVVGALLASGAAAGTTAGLDRVRAQRALRWCGDVQGGEPYVFQDPAGGDRLVGFEVELADAIARRLGVEAAFVQNDWQMLVAALERGDCDVILNGLEDLQARAAKAGRDMKTISVSVFGAKPDEATMESYTKTGVTRAILRLPSDGRDVILPLLDQYAKLIR